MSISVVVFLLIYVTGLILTFYHPIFGLLTYVFEWHNHPPYQFWGEHLPNLRWSLTPAVLTLVSLVIHRKKLRELVNPNYKPLIWLTFFVLNAFLVSATVAVVPEESFRKADLLLKLAVLYVVMVSLVREEKHYYWLIWVIILCVGNMGRLAFEVGDHRDLGFKLPGSTEANALSAHMMAILPFFFFYFLKGNRWQKGIIILMLPFVLNALVLANSRGTFLGMLAIAFFTFLWTSGKIRFRLVLVLALVGLLFVHLSNEEFWERQSTISTEKESGKPRTRILLWEGALRIFQRNLFGIGGEGFENVGIEYVDRELAAKMVVEGNKTVHNTFLQVMVEWGILGIVFYLLFLAHSFWLLVKVKRRARHFPEVFHFYNEATAVQLALIGILVAGMFHNRQYAELITWLCAFAAILYNLQQTRLAQVEQEAEQIRLQDEQADLIPQTAQMGTTQK